LILNVAQKFYKQSKLQGGAACEQVLSGQLS